MTTTLKTSLLITLLTSRAFAGGHTWEDDAKKELAANGKVLVHVINRGSMIYSSATPAQIAQCPDWDAKSNPPLSMTNAIELARAQIEQACWLDIIKFIDYSVAENGPHGKSNDVNRVRIKIGQYLTWNQHKSLLPPHATEWHGIPDPAVLTFKARNISALELLGIIIGVGELNYTIQGNVVVVNDPKTAAH